MYENLLIAEKQNERSFLSKIKAYPDQEINADFDYKEMSNIASLLINFNQKGIK